MKKSGFTQSGEFKRIVDWTGVVTEQVESIRRWAGSEYIVSVEITGVPEWSYEGVNLVTKTVVYRVTPDTFLVAEGPYNLTGFGHLDWPINVGQRWGQPPSNAAGPDVGVWRIVEIAEYHAATHVFTGCYHLEEIHNTGLNVIWICPGFGVVRAEQYSTGIAYSEIWELLPP